MSSSVLARITRSILKTLTPGTSRSPEKEPGRPGVSGAPEGRAAESRAEAGRVEGRDTRRVDADRLPRLRIGYAPERDGAPDAGEIVWTWVPYEEDDGRGKDRPVLVIGRASADRVYAVRMTSAAHGGDDRLSIGSGPWDSRGRESWVDIGQLYTVQEEGLRREAAVLERKLFRRVADALVRRYGWVSDVEEAS